MSDPERAFLAAILAAPDDDGLRLIYADWLEDPGTDPARGELIRVQCELAVLRGRRDSLERIFPLMDREAALLDADDARTLRWFGLPQPWARVVRTEPFDTDAPDYSYAIARRGFVDEVRCPAAAWMECGPSAVACQPVRRVRLTDRRPVDFSDGQSTWWGFYVDRNTPAGAGEIRLPLALADFLKAPGGWRKAGVQNFRYPTERQALDAISAACLAWAKGPGHGLTVKLDLSALTADEVDMGLGSCLPYGTVMVRDGAGNLTRVEFPDQ